MTGINILTETVSHVRKEHVAYGTLNLWGSRHQIVIFEFHQRFLYWDFPSTPFNFAFTFLTIDTLKCIQYNKKDAHLVPRRHIGGYCSVQDRAVLRRRLVPYSSVSRHEKWFDVWSISISDPSCKLISKSLIATSYSWSYRIEWYLILVVGVHVTMGGWISFFACLFTVYTHVASFFFLRNRDVCRICLSMIFSPNTPYVNTLIRLCKTIFWSKSKSLNVRSKKSKLKGSIRWHLLSKQTRNEGTKAVSSRKRISSIEHKRLFQIW